MNKLHYLINVFAQGFGRVFASVASLVVFIFIARLAGADLLGKYSYIITFLGLFMVAADFGSQVVLARDIAQAKETAPRYWGNFLVVRLGFCAVAMIVCFIAGYFLRPDLWLYLFAGSLALPFLCSRFFEPIYQIYGRPWYSTSTSMLYGAVYGLGSLVVILLGGGLEGLVTVFILANIVYTVVAFRLALRLLQPQFLLEKKLMGSIIALSVPVGVSSLYTIINSKADVLMLATLRSDAEVGVYNAAYRFLDIAAMLASTLVIPLIPIFSRWVSEDREVLRANYRKIIEMMAVVLVPAAVLTPLVSGPMVSLFFGHEFAASADVLNILAWVGVLVFYSLISSVVNLAVGDIKHAYWNGAVAAGLNIALNFWWIPQYGFIGSSWAKLISEVSLLGVCLFFVGKNLGRVFDLRHWAAIVLINLLLFFVLHQTLWPLPVAVRIVVGLAAYVFLVVRWRLFDLGLLRHLINRKVKGPS